MTDPVPSKATCHVCDTPDGDHLDWCTPQAREQRPSKELTEAVAIANRLLDEPFADPDDDARTVARQFLRGREAIERLQVIEKLYNEQCEAGYARGSASEPAPAHGGRIMTLAECVEAEGGIPFVGMEASTEPLTHQEIFSAVHHHASEIVRLTAAVPAQCSSQPPGAEQG